MKKSMHIILCVLCVFVVSILFCCSKPIEPINRPMEGTFPATSEKENPAIPLDASKVIAELKTELGEGFIIDYLEPFAIAGNISQREFDRFKKGTIKECSYALFKDYFDKRPDYILKVYLFKDAETYESYCEKTDGRKPSSPYGFYQDATKSLIMNISTGGGTLVHEMVHALIEPDFPNVPAWFNEGLGSLYEQCTIMEDGSLRGLINWRYKGLMESVKDNTLVPLKEIFSMTDNKFYGTNSGYAQARYFCLYLQEKHVLTQFYKKFRDGFSTDKTGIKFIAELLSPANGGINSVPTNVGKELLKKSIDEIDKDWQKWIITVKDIEELR